jgi:hypothetical protein
MTTRKVARGKVEGKTGKRGTRRRTLTRKSRRKMRTGRNTSQGRRSLQEEGQGMYLALVQAPHGVGQPQGRALPTWQ